MYGFFSIPKSSSQSQKIKYKKHMCALCDSLHDNFGVRGRFYTNFDLTTIAIIFASIDSDEPEIRDNSKIFCSRLISHKKAPEIYSVFSAISIMLAYCRILDEKQDSISKPIPDWLKQKVELANTILINYGLDKTFFEKTIQNQHNIENIEYDIDALSTPTQEMVSHIFEQICIKIGIIEKIPIMKSLGEELGKLIYIYDGIVDYQTDQSSDSFNCIQRCYIRENSISIELADKVINYINSIKVNIERIIDLGFSKNIPFIKQILLQDVLIREKASNNWILEKIPLNMVKINNKILYGILTGSFVVQTVSADSGSSILSNPMCLCICCIICVTCGAGCSDGLTGKTGPC